MKALDKKDLMIIAHYLATKGVNEFGGKHSEYMSESLKIAHQIRVNYEHIYDYRKLHQILCDALQYKLSQAAKRVLNGKTAIEFINAHKDSLKKWVNPKSSADIRYYTNGSDIFYSEKARAVSARCMGKVQAVNNVGINEFIVALAQNI